jgi:ABC-type polysaccharide transport system permease subunit
VSGAASVVCCVTAFLPAVAIAFLLPFIYMWEQEEIAAFDALFEPQFLSLLVISSVIAFTLSYDDVVNVPSCADTGEQIFLCFLPSNIRQRWRLRWQAI